LKRSGCKPLPRWVTFRGNRFADTIDHSLAGLKGLGDFKITSDNVLYIFVQSPFGAAKPRELVIATREGKSEEDILRDEVKKERLHVSSWLCIMLKESIIRPCYFYTVYETKIVSFRDHFKSMPFAPSCRFPLTHYLIYYVYILQLRLNASQLEEKRAHEAAVKEIQEQVEAEEDVTKKEVLRVELATREAKLTSLTERFAKTTLEAAMSGEAPRVSQMRKQQLEAAAAAAPPQITGQYPGGAGGGVAQGSNYNPRYNPTQQYAGPNQRGGYQQQQQQHGGFEHYNAGGRNYVPRGGRGGRGAGRGGGATPEWAQEDYPAGRGGGAHRGGFDSSGGYRPAPGGGYGDTSDAGFFDQPSGGGGGGSRGSRGGGGGNRGGRGGRGGNYYDVFNPTGYGGGGGRGVGGEINFDMFAGQDRY